MLELPNVTLCCVDTSHHTLSNLALQHCTNEAKFAKTVFITDQPQFVREDWECHRIKTFESYREFNHFMLKNLYFHIETPYVLIVQFDGFITDTSRWLSEFLEYDYIGAPWPCTNKDYAIGTGGFSLRSRRLLKALQDDAIMLPPDNDAEDLCICRNYKSYLYTRHGVTIAPYELGTKFAYESGDRPSETFGFHGLRHLAEIYPGDISAFIVDNLQTYILRNPASASLALRYFFIGREDIGTRLLNRIAELQSYEETRQKLVARMTDEPLHKATIDYFDTTWKRYITDKSAA